MFKSRGSDLTWLMSAEPKKELLAFKKNIYTISKNFAVIIWSSGEDLLGCQLTGRIAAVFNVFSFWIIVLLTLLLLHKDTTFGNEMS